MSPNAPPDRPGHGRKLNVLFLHDAAALHTNTVREHLESFAWFSRHQIFYAHAVNGAPLDMPLDLFDVVVLHYSVRLAYTWHLAPAFAEALPGFQGLKVLFIQDEYEQTAIAADWINRLGIDLVFTCVPSEHVRSIYTTVNHDRVEFLPTLTGYIPLSLEKSFPVLPLRERPILVGYRSRTLPYHLGRLAREKYVIGTRMRAVCEAFGVSHDIAWTEDRRLYGDDWIRFLLCCRTTLGTESGANVFDHDGSLSAQIKDELKRNPQLTFEQAHDRFLKGRELDGLMNQVSPRIFEAVALRTGLILFEGKYSGVVQPWEHFLPLKKDFSNVKEVLRLAQDDAYMEAMIGRAYRDVIESGRYTYQAFVAGVDEILAARARADHRPRLVVRLEGTGEANAGFVGARACSLPLPTERLQPPPPTMRQRLVRLLPMPARAFLRKVRNLSRAVLG